MTMYINVGAYSDNQRIKTKSQLKQMVKDSPELVRFDQTSPLAENHLSRTIEVNMLNPQIVLSVVGPDPYISRKWYASVTIKNGKATVS